MCNYRYMWLMCFFVINSVIVYVFCAHAYCEPRLAFQEWGGARTFARTVDTGYILSSVVQID